MAATTPHHCTGSCVCPIHDTPLIYAPLIDDHACQDAKCVLGGGTDPTRFGSGRRFDFIQARWEHGHDDMVDGCTLCHAEYDEAYAYTQGR
jgi:hypothetical protein